MCHCTLFLILLKSHLRIKDTQNCCCPQTIPTNIWEFSKLWKMGNLGGREMLHPMGLISATSYCCTLVSTSLKNAEGKKTEVFSPIWYLNLYAENWPRFHKAIGLQPGKIRKAHCITTKCVHIFITARLCREGKKEEKHEKIKLVDV